MLSSKETGACIAKILFPLTFTKISRKIPNKHCVILSVTQSPNQTSAADFVQKCLIDSVCFSVFDVMWRQISIPAKCRLIGPQLPLSHPLVFSQSERGCWSMASAFLTPSPSLPSPPPPNILSFHTFLHIQLRSKVEL